MRKVDVKMNKPIYLGLAMLDISKTFLMTFGVITLNLNTKRKQDYATRIEIALLFTLKQKIFTKILQAMLKDGLILQIMLKRIKDLF